MIAVLSHTTIAVPVYNFSAIPLQQVRLLCCRGWDTFTWLQPYSQRLIRRTLRVTGSHQHSPHETGDAGDPERNTVQIQITTSHHEGPVVT